MDNEMQSVTLSVFSRQRDHSSRSARARYVLSSLRRSLVGMMGVTIVTAVLLVAIIGPSISPLTRSSTTCAHASSRRVTLPSLARIGWERINWAAIFSAGSSKAVAFQS